MANNEKELNPKEATDALSAAVNKKLREIEAKIGKPLQGIEIQPGCKYLLVLDSRCIGRLEANAVWDAMQELKANVSVILSHDPLAYRLFEVKE